MLAREVAAQAKPKGIARLVRDGDVCHVREGDGASRPDTARVSPAREDGDTRLPNVAVMRMCLWVSTRGDGGDARRIRDRSRDVLGVERLEAGGIRLDRSPRGRSREVLGAEGDTADVERFIASRARRVTDSTGWHARLNAEDSDCPTRPGLASGDHARCSGGRGVVGVSDGLDRYPQESSGRIIARACEGLRRGVPNCYNELLLDPGRDGRSILTGGAT